MAKKNNSDDWFAREIRIAMASFGWKQYHLARKAKLNPDTIGRALNRPPSDDPRALESRIAIVSACERAGHAFSAAWRERAIA